MAPSSKYLLIAASLVVTVLCGLLSVMSLAAALVAQPAGDTIERLRKGETVSEARIGEAATLSIRAGALFEPGRHFSNAALAVGRLRPDARNSVLRGETEATLVDRALMAEPASPHNWARRASFQLASGDFQGARASLETSLILGRFVPGLTMPRLRILLALRSKMPDPQLESYFAEQVRIAARTQPGALAAFADGGAAEGLAQRFLAPDFALYDAYLKALTARRAEAAQARERARR